MKKSLLRGTGILLALLLTACGGKEEEIEVQTIENPELLPFAGDNQVKNMVSSAEGEELMAVVSSEEEAQSIADQYGITLVHYGHGVATFHTEEDLGTLIQRGKDNGWPALKPNHSNSAID